jgi:hypothetical protein
MHLAKKISRKKKIIEKHEKELRELFASCTHEQIIPKFKYYPGNYNDKAETHSWSECVLCGEHFENRIVTHNWYG